LASDGVNFLCKVNDTICIVKEFLPHTRDAQIASHDATPGLLPEVCGWTLPRFRIGRIYTIEGASEQMFDETSPEHATCSGHRDGDWLVKMSH
jgi:hypothetical protein